MSICTQHLMSNLVLSTGFYNILCFFQIYIIFLIYLLSYTIKINIFFLFICFILLNILSDGLIYNRISSLQLNFTKQIYSSNR